MQRANSLEETLMLEKIEGKRRREWQRMRCLDTITSSMDMNVSKLREIVEDRGAWHAAVHGVPKSWTRLSDWTTVFFLYQAELSEGNRKVHGTSTVTWGSVYLNRRASLASVITSPSLGSPFSTGAGWRNWLAHDVQVHVLKPGSHHP